MSLRAPALSLAFVSAALLAPPARAAGEGEAPSASCATLVKRFAAVDRFGIKYANVVEIDPARCRIKTVSARRLKAKRASVPKLMEAVPEGVAAINAGFFPKPGEGRSDSFDGYFVEDGVELPHNGKQHTVFYVTKDGRPHVASASRLPRDGSIESAVAGLSAGHARDAEAPRSAVCITASGSVKLAAVYPAATLDLMGRFLREEEQCAEVVHLDGGGSTQMVYDAGEDSFAVGWERPKKGQGGKPPLRCYEGDAEQPPACFRLVSSALIAIRR